MPAHWMAVDSNGELRRKARCGLRRFLAAVTFINFRLFMLGISSLCFTISGTSALITARAHHEIKPTLNVFAVIELTIAIVTASALCAGISPWRTLRYNLPVAMEVIWTMSISPVAIFTAFLSVETLYTPPTAFALSQLPESERASIPIVILKQGYAAVDKSASAVVLGSNMGAFFLVIYCLLLVSLAIHENRSPLRQAFSSSHYTTIYNTFVHATPFHHQDQQYHARSHWQARFRPTQFCNAAGYPALFASVPSIIDILALWTGEPFWAYGDVGVWRWRWRWRLGWGVRDEAEAEAEESTRARFARELVVEREERENVLWGRFMVLTNTHERNSRGVCVRQEDGRCSCDEKVRISSVTAVNTKAREEETEASNNLDATKSASSVINSMVPSSVTFPLMPVVNSQGRWSRQFGHARSRHQFESGLNLPVLSSVSSLGPAPSSQYLTVPGELNVSRTNSPVLAHQRSVSAPHSLCIGSEPSAVASVLSTGSKVLSDPHAGASSSNLLPLSQSYSFEGNTAIAHHPRPRSRSQSQVQVRSTINPFSLVGRYRYRVHSETRDYEPEVVHRSVDPSEFIEFGRNKRRDERGETHVNASQHCRNAGQIHVGTSPAVGDLSGEILSIPSVASLVKVPTESERKRIFVAFEV